MSFFEVPLSPQDQDVELATPNSCVGRFRAETRQPTAPLLPRPTPRQKPDPSGLHPQEARRSVRVAKRRAGDGTIPVQQCELIRRLGRAHEGEMIGDDALQVYINLFAQPLTPQQIAAILSLFGWEPPAPLGERDDQVVVQP